MASAVQRSVGSIHATSYDRSVMDEDTADWRLVCIKGELCLRMRLELLLAAF